MTMYCTLSDLRSYLGAGTTTSDDALLTGLIQAASQEIDVYCRRWFDGRAGTQYYSRFTDRRTNDLLYLDSDVIQVDHLINGTGATLGPESYWLWPRNTPPYSMIKLKSNWVWLFNVDGEVTVAGTFGYAATIPPDVTQATKELSAYLYRLKDSSTFDVTATPELGQLTIPKGWPQHVKVDLTRYRRTEYR